MVAAWTLLTLATGATLNGMFRVRRPEFGKLLLTLTNR